MPAEWEAHERTWMAWPAAPYMFEGDQQLDSTNRPISAFKAWSEVANAIVEFEPVTMMVDPRYVADAKAWLNPKIEIVVTQLDDSWMRDMGPTFVRDEAGSIAGVDWIYNGWGAQHWAKWDHDSAMATLILDRVDKPKVPSQMINEGGGIHVNGVDTVLITKTVQLDPGRNPELNSSDVEAELMRTLGVKNVVWLERGLTRDYDEFGTRGHVDIVSCFSDANTILYHDQQNPEHPDYAVSQEVKARLSETGFKLIAVPAPKILADEEGFVDYSYINHYVCNGGVVLCAFDDPNDQVAKEILEQAYPGRKVVLVDAREIFARGGGIHCITQQQPL